MNSNNIFQLRTFLQNAQSILIAFPEGANDDIVAAALALYLTLGKMQKQVTIVAPNDVKVAQAHLFGIDKISKQLLGGNALVVSFPYQEGSIEKVTYNIEGDLFNLVIEPREDKLQFSQEDVRFNYGKGDYDTVFVLGTPELKALGDLYKNHSAVFSQKAIINIDKNPNNSKFGQINFVEEAPISQTITQILRMLRVPLDQDSASNLYTGVVSSGVSLRLDEASADTLESVAYLLRAKARLLQTDHISTKTQSDLPVKEKKVSDKIMQLPQEEVINGQSLDSQDDQAPEDWLKPKIFSTRNN